MVALGCVVAFVMLLHHVYVDVKGNVEVLDRIEKAFPWETLDKDMMAKMVNDERVSVSGARMDFFPKLRTFIQEYVSHARA